MSKKAKLRHVYINGEHLKTRAVTHFHYHGKRHLIADYLKKLPIEDTTVVPPITPTEDIITTTPTDITENTKNEEAPFSNPGTKDTKIGFDVATGAIVINPSESEVIRMSEDTKHTKEREVTTDTPMIKRGIDTFKMPDTFKSPDTSTALDALKSSDALSLLIPAILIGAGILMKKEKTLEGNALMGNRAREGWG